MPKLEPGMLCRVVIGGPYEGRVLTVLNFVGRVGHIGNKKVNGDDWWETDLWLPYAAHPEIPPDTLFRAIELEPIKRDDTPAEEGFQQRLKQLLCKEKQRSVSKQ